MIFFVIFSRPKKIVFSIAVEFENQIKKLVSFLFRVMTLFDDLFDENDPLQGPAALLKTC